MASGIKVEYNCLVKLYHAYGTNVLTSIKEMNHEILKYLSLIDLVHFSIITKSAHLILDSHFWLLKYKYDELPLDLKYPTLIEYSKISKAKIIAKAVLEVNRIEMNRDKTSGFILIRYEHDNRMIRDILTILNNQPIQALLNKIDVNSKDRLRLTILPEKNDYKLYFTYYTLNKSIQLGSYDCNYKMIWSILTLMYKYQSDYKITISNGNGHMGKDKLSQRI